MVEVASVTSTTANLMWSQSIPRQGMFLIDFWQTGQPSQTFIVDSNFLVPQQSTYNASVTLDAITSSTVIFTTCPLSEGGTVKSVAAGNENPDDGNEICVAALWIK